MLRRTRRSSTARWAALVIATFLLTPALAAAEDLIVIPVSGSSRGQEGDVVTIATVSVPDDVVGATCQITGSTINQVSVHEGNDLLIITGGQTFVVPNFEDEGFIIHEAGETTSVGATIELQIRFGPDGVSSGGFRVSIDCEPEPGPTQPPTTPSTTAPPTTDEPTTAAPTTAAPTTAAPTTAVPPTTEVPPAGPSTPSTTPPSSIPPSTDVGAEPPATASPPTAPPTTTPPTTTEPATEAPPAGPEASGDGGLPVTGSSTNLLVGLGLLLVGLGLIVQRVGGRVSRSH